MKARKVLTIACWTVAAVLIVPLGSDSWPITAMGAALSSLFLVMGSRRADSNALAMAAIFLAATYGRAVMFAEGTDDFAPLVAVALVAYLIAANSISDGPIETHDGYWQARLRLGGLWLVVATGVAAGTATVGALESNEPRLVWLIGLAATIVLLALIAATGRSQSPSL